MRIAIISDIHGNSNALSAVISDISENSVDSIICLGDVITLGPSPREVLKILRELDCPCIIGNHEEALFEPEKASKFDIKGELLSKTIYWCLDKLKPDDIAFLKSFKPTITIDLSDEISMLCYHGSPLSSTDSIDSSTLNEQLDYMFNVDKSIKIAVGGHTHSQMLRSYKDLKIINAGSVGCAFRIPPRVSPTPSLSSGAEYVIIDCNENKTSVEFKRINYNISDFLNILNNSDLPLKNWWCEQFTILGY